MHYSVNNLEGYAVGARDGDIGKVDDFYFDDGFWTIRYLVAETGNWLLNRKVLISPFALGEVDVPGKRLKVTLTKKQVEKSPSIDTDKPVSRQHEVSYFDYYGYPYYWSGPYLWGPTTYPRLSEADRWRDEEARVEREAAYDAHLRSANKVTGYHWPDPLKSVQMLSYTLDPNSREAGNEEERVHPGADHHHAKGG
jgi:hypothetical protein